MRLSHKVLGALAALALLAASVFPVNAATTLLPNAKQCFGNAGGPLVGGSVYMYYPSTNVFKPTWTDSTQSSANPQPIPLDSDGCALIYGVGSYRQVVFDATASLVWDQITTDTSAYNAVFWAALAGGTPNVITIVDTGFNATDGSVINFTALATNTSGVTINPSGYGAIPVLKDTTAGPVALTGGEIIQSNVISVVYRSMDNAFHLLNPPIQSASGTTAPLCGASRLKITNDASTPNSIIDLTATYGVMVSSGGLVISRTNLSLTTINISLGTTPGSPVINGMDGEAPGMSNWLYVWIVDNGAASAGLVSLASGNGLTPALPSGYIYKCLMGAMQVDGSGDLMRTIQYGNEVQYVVSSATTTALPLIDHGAVGTFSATASPMTAWKAETVQSATSAVIPPIGTIGHFIGVTKYNNANRSSYAIAPNALYGGISSTNPSPCGVVVNGNDDAKECDLVLEAATIQAASADTGFGLYVRGFKLGGVNAN